MLGVYQFLEGNNDITNFKLRDFKALKNTTIMGIKDLKYEIFIETKSNNLNLLNNNWSHLKWSSTYKYNSELSFGFILNLRKRKLNYKNL